MSELSMTDYYVNAQPDELIALKRTLGALAAEHASTPLLVSSLENGQEVTQTIDFRVGSIRGEDGFSGRGIVTFPDGRTADASILDNVTENGNEYLVVQTANYDALNPTDTPNED